MQPYLCPCCERGYYDVHNRLSIVVTEKCLICNGVEQENNDTWENEGGK